MSVVGMVVVLHNALVRQEACVVSKEVLMPGRGFASAQTTALQPPTREQRLDGGAPCLPVMNTTRYA